VPEAIRRHPRHGRCCTTSWPRVPTRGRGPGRATARCRSATGPRACCGRPCCGASSGRAAGSGKGGTALPDRG
jgi:hypothetical protein